MGRTVPYQPSRARLHGAGPIASFCEFATHRLPRKLNRAAHYALSAAVLAKARQVSADHVQSALDEFRP